MMAAQEGDSVRAGQLVAKIDDTEQRAQRARAIAAVRAAEARLAQSVAGGRVKDVGAEGDYARARAATATARARLAQVEHQAQIQDTASETRVRTAQAGLKSAQERLGMMREGSRRQELQVAQQSVRRAEIDLATEQRNYQRREQLLKDGAIAQEDVDEARRRVEFAQVQLANAREQLSMAQEGPRSQEVRMAEEQVTQAEQAVQDAEANRAQRQISQEEVNAAREALVQAQAAERSARAGLVQSQLTREDVRTAAAAVEQARADVAYYNEQIRQMRIVSPVSGIVTQKYVNVGESVAPANAKLYTIVSRDSLFFEAVVSERQLQWLRPGQTVRVSVDARPGKVYGGTVREILPVSEGISRSSRVRIALRGARDLPVGAFARAVIPVSQKAGVLAIPAATVQSEAGISYVFVIDGQGRARRRNVELGIRDGDRVEVMSGLRSGDRIVSSGSPAITDGAKVTTQG
jgi:HlyD family secretion protein